MEFVDYYRIIRERVWFPVLLAVLSAAVVVVLRAIRPPEPSAATGALSINTAALRRPEVADGAVSMAEPEWRVIAREVTQVVGSPQIAREVARRVPGIGADLTAGGVTLGSEVARDTPVVRVTARAAEAEIAVAAANAAMAATLEVLGELHRERFRRANEAVAQQSSAATRRVSAAKQRLEGLRSRYGTRDPNEEVNALKAEFASLATRRSELVWERVSVTAREQMLLAAVEEQPRYETIEQVQGTGGPLPPSEIEAQLNAVIADLQEALKRRTPRHPTVLEMQRRIDELRRQAEAIREAPAETVSTRIPSPVWATLEGQLWDMRLTTATIGAQMQWVEAQTTEKRARLDQLQPATIEYDRLSAELTAAQQEVDGLEKAMADLSRQAEAVVEAEVGEVQEEASEVAVGRGLRRLALRIGAALMCGAILGGMLAFFLHYVDLSFKDEESAQRVLGQPVLGAIPRSDMPTGETEAESPGEQAAP